MNRSAYAHIVLAGLLVLVRWTFADVPEPVVKLLAEMRESGASVRGGVSQELGVFIIGIGHARYRPGAVSRSREIAQAHALKEVTSALEQSIKAHDVVALNMPVGDDGTVMASSFVSSLTETSIDQLVKGGQVISVEKNAEGEMECALYIASRKMDTTDVLLRQQGKWGDKGVVTAIGIDASREIAEKNALRSAVEQVAGTLVVGKIAINEKEEMHKRLATTAGALVEEYRIVKEAKVDAEFQVEIVARVNKRKLYESYRSYFKCLDNPMFCLVATDESLSRHFSQFFVEKGFPLTNDPTEAHYLIRLNGSFRDRPTPGNSASMGTMLELGIEIVSANGARPLLTMNERQAKDSEVLSGEQRREETARRIFNKLETNLHKAIQDMVVRMLDEADEEKGVSVPTSGTIF